MDQRTWQGAYLAASAYLFWGVVPIYFKWIDHVNPWEILAHRVFWSVPLLIAVIWISRQYGSLKVNWQTMKVLAITSVLLVINWMVFIVAILDNNITETSLGYYIAPLVSVFLGTVFLAERPRRLQWMAVAIASSGIAYQSFLYGSIPWYALGLAFSFGFYGLFRKRLNLASAVGLLLETLLILPFALLVLGWFFHTDNMSFVSLGWQTTLLLCLGGFVTSFPLLCFAAAVTRLSLTAISGFQYIAPTLSLLIAIVVYGEPFGIGEAVTFICIWTALALYSVDAWHSHRNTMKTPQ